MCWFARVEYTQNQTLSGEVLQLDGACHTQTYRFPSESPVGNQENIGAAFSSDDGRWAVIRHRRAEFHGSKGVLSTAGGGAGNMLAEIGQDRDLIWKQPVTTLAL